MDNLHFGHKMESGVTVPNYSYVFHFEQEFIHSEIKPLFDTYWRQVCIYSAGLYFLLIIVGQQYMAARPRFEIRNCLTAWNIFLALFSIMGAARTLPEFLHVLKTHGIYHSVCIPSFIESDKVSGFWTLMFVLSKVPELGDTVFIVLRKQPLIFLHWYHHMTVLLYAWYSYSEYTAAARWFIVMNYIVHSVMYSYYAFKALKFRVPRSISMVITALQLVQMVVGCLVNFWVIQMKQSSLECHVSDQNIKFSLLMYTSYFVLFGRFFYNAYLANQLALKSKSV
uniref:Elongation of very long chain fatty acids protein n=1 Tax=Platychelipus littoralis TaxID=2593136 RepID=A0A9E8LRH0_9MAXI|nr:fatty acid elongase elovl6 [Platychelipus littoralis]